MATQTVEMTQASCLVSAQDEAKERFNKKNEQKEQRERTGDSANHRRDVR